MTALQTCGNKHLSAFCLPAFDTRLLFSSQRPGQDNQTILSPTFSGSFSQLWKLAFLGISREVCAANPLPLPVGELFQVATKTKRINFHVHSA